MQVSKDGLATTEIYGVLSLIIWALMLIVTLKYVVFLLHADNKDEGGILALMALVKDSLSQPKSQAAVLCIGIVGAALFYGDAAITPAISVMSAVEGLKLVTPALEHYILPISIVLICILFVFQRHGTGKVSAFFGPITVIWFLSMAYFGVIWVLKHPEVLHAFNPQYGVSLILSHGWLSILVLGAVFLSVTGAEALYADMGHFGLKPIQRAWIFFVFPCLVLNYLGQGALILENPEAIKNPFFLMVPEDFLLPMVILAACATIIASQAVITGAYSLTRQAIQLGLLPRMEIRHTSDKHHGQIYMPKVNYLLLCGVILLCILFQNSTNLAAAYGIAVCGTMVITSLMIYLVITKVWKKSPLLGLLVTIPILSVELIFLAANLMRVFEGGFVPLLFGGYLSLLMLIWVSGGKYLNAKAEKQRVLITDFAKKLEVDNPHVVKGTAIFFTADPEITPDSLLKNLQYNQIIHEHNVILTVITCASPVVAESGRVVVEALSPKLQRVVLYFGFMETPDVPKALLLANRQGHEIDIRHATFYLARHKLVSDPHSGLPTWQDNMYLSLRGFAIGEHDFFKLPRARVVELGVQVSI